MAGRGRTFDEKAVIGKAIEVFWTQGYEAASTEVLQEAMGLGKGSFYNTYKGGKQEVFEKAIQQFNEESDARFLATMQAAPRKLEFIRNFFRMIAHTSKAVHLKGCFMGNTVAELANVEPMLKARAVRALKELEHLFLQTLRAAQAAGELRPGTDIETLALYLVNLWNGINITRRMYPTPEKLESLIELQLQVLG